MLFLTQSIHQKYGGVVPELASRAHQRNIIPVVDNALKRAGVLPRSLNAIAFTRGPGLLGSLLVGVSFAKAMALALNISLIEVNHMQAHILAHFIQEPYPSFPFLCLTVSGGHTQLVLVTDYLDMKIIGQTQDDAVGEAFDKIAKIMQFPYPGGAVIDKYAQNGNPYAFIFPDVNVPKLNFSFSGIKTAFLYFIQKECKKDPHFIQNNLADICASIQYKLVQILLKKLIKAACQYHLKCIALAGGVAANSFLRKAIKHQAEIHGWKIFIPAIEYCTDNAAMVAVAGYYKYLKGEFSSQEIAPLPRMSLEKLN